MTTQEMTEDDLSPDAVVCNCCECGRLIRCDNLESRLAMSRIMGRPYCGWCAATGKGGVPAGRPATADDTSPGWENMIRALEGDWR